MKTHRQTSVLLVTSLIGLVTGCPGKDPTVDTAPPEETSPDTAAETGDTAHDSGSGDTSDSGTDTSDTGDTASPAGPVPVEPRWISGYMDPGFSKMSEFRESPFGGPMGVVFPYAGDTFIYTGGIGSGIDLGAPDVWLDEGGRIDAGSDLDGDGYGDVLIDEEVYWGPLESAMAADIVVGPRTIESECSDGTPRDVVAVEDLGGGPLPDLVFSNQDDPTGGGVPCPYDTTLDSPAGAAYILYGPPSETADLDDADAVILGREGYQYLGIGLTDLGDTDGDGLHEVGMLAMDDHYSLFVFNPPFAPLVHLDDRMFHYDTGTGVGTIGVTGDWNGDGYSDIGSNSESSEEEYFVIALCPCSGSPSPSDLPVRVVPPPGESRSAEDFASAGDLDGDDREDLVLVSSNVWVLLGGETGVIEADTAASYTLQHSLRYWHPDTLAGHDMDGDDLSDVLLMPNTDEGNLHFYSGADMPF